MSLNCEDIIRQSLGRSMTEEEVLEFAAEAKRLARRASAGRDAADGGKGIRELTSRYMQDRRIDLAARKRATEMQQAARLRGVNYAVDNFAGMEWEGLSAMLVGSKYVRSGGRMSVDALRGSLTGKYLGGLFADMESLGPAIWNLFSKGKLEREVMEALFSLDREGGPGYAGPAEAMKMAEVLHKWQEIARLAENDAGAWIGKLPGYILRQSHDAAKLERAGVEVWRGDIENRLDWDRTADGRLKAATDEERQAFLENVFDNLVTGIHEKTGGNAGQLSVSRGGGSLAERVSRHRVLHFKSGGDFFEYNEKYGRGGLAEGVIAGLSKSANDTALMQVFGPSPQANLAGMIKDIKLTLESRKDVQGIRKMNAATRRLENQMKELDGTLNMGGDARFADVSRNLRALQSMSKLGAAVISGFSDIPLLAQEMKYQGRGYFKSIADGLAEFVKGRGSLEQRRILSACGVFFDSMAGNITARFSGQELPGKMTALMNLFFKVNGMSFWSDAWKKSATLMMAHDLASLKAKPFAQLSKPRQRALLLYGIDEARWDLLRKGKMTAADGREYFTADVAESLKDKDIEKYMQTAGLLVSPERVRAMRGELANQVRSYFKDRVQYAVLEPDARTQSIIHQGQAAGTVTGELLRLCLQFKSFPIVFLQRTFGREIYGRGADTALRGLAQAFIPKGGEITGMAGMILMTTLFGYLSMTAKQLLSGKNPRDFTESPEAFGKVFLAAMVQGGGAGIYGDFLLGEKSRMGDDFLSTLAGPTMGTASSLVSLYKSMRDGEDVESQAFRTMWSQLPGNNLFWIRPAMDHMLLYSMYEYMNPGYIKRLRRKIKKENNQTFYLQPNVWDWAKHRHKKK